MCGISAAYNVKNAPERAIKILLGQESRGTDASGVAFIKNKKLNIIKRAEKASDFYRNHCPKERSSIIAIAHNRAASSNIPEKDKDKEAHPFINESKEFCIVHNGSVREDDVLRSLFTNVLGHDFSSGVDSEVYLHMLEEILIRCKDRSDAIYRLFENISGNLLILFKDGELWGIPNTDSFVVAMVDDTVYIASEIDAIKEILPTSEDEEIKVWKIEHARTTTSDQLVRIRMDKNKKTELTMFGTWTPLKVIGEWFGLRKIRCDFCGDHTLCEKHRIGANERDRCYKCFKAGKENIIGFRQPTTLLEDNMEELFQMKLKQFMHIVRVLTISTK